MRAAVRDEPARLDRLPPTTLIPVLSAACRADMSRDEWRNMQAKLCSRAYFDERSDRRRQLERLAQAGDPVARAIRDTLCNELEKLQRVSIGRMLYRTIRRNLETWEGGGGGAAVEVGDDGPAAPCPVCVGAGVAARNAGQLAPAALRRLWEDTRRAVRVAEGSAKPVLPTLDCGRGHLLTAEQIRAAHKFLQESAPCPHCTAQPPGFFSRLRCLTYFDENDSDHMGVAKCAKWVPV